MAAKCKACSKSIYPMDPQINLDGTKFHKSCAKCSDCDCQITISNFTKNESSDTTVLLCKIHYFKRFHEGGSYLGGEKFRVKSTRDMKLPSTLPTAGGADAQAEQAPQSSVQALKSVFNATKTETPAPAPVKAAIPVKEEVVVESEPIVQDVSEPAASTETVTNNTTTEAEVSVSTEDNEETAPVSVSETVTEESGTELTQTDASESVEEQE